MYEKRKKEKKKFNLFHEILLIFQENAYEKNMNTELCMNLPMSYTHIGHLLDCNRRHKFKYETVASESLFNMPRRCQIKILHVFSPSWFSVRIIRHKTTKLGEWNEHYSAKLFEKFDKEFNEFYTHNFQSTEVNSLNIDKLYVHRNGEKFSRCRFLSKL